jgi:hypothetical protein
MGMYGDYFIREFGSQQMSSQGKQLKSTLIELLKRIKVQGNLQQRINYAKKIRSYIYAICYKKRSI